VAKAFVPMERPEVTATSLRPQALAALPRLLPTAHPSTSIVFRRSESLRPLDCHYGAAERSASASSRFQIRLAAPTSSTNPFMRKATS